MKVYILYKTWWAHQEAIGVFASNELATIFKHEYTQVRNLDPANLWIDDCEVLGACQDCTVSHLEFV